MRRDNKCGNRSVLLGFEKKVISPPPSDDVYWGITVLLACNYYTNQFLAPLFSHKTAGIKGGKLVSRIGIVSLLYFQSVEGNMRLTHLSLANETSRAYFIAISSQFAIKSRGKESRQIDFSPSSSELSSGGIFKRRAICECRGKSVGRRIFFSSASVFPPIDNFAHSVFPNARGFPP